MMKAFTLIELLIVVAIIAILAAIAVPNFLEAQVRAKVSRAKADMRTLATALESYNVDANKPMTAIVYGLPNAISGPSLFNGAATGAVSPRFIRLTTPVAYITSVLQDPFVTNGLTVTNTGDLSSAYDTFDYISAYDFAPGGFSSDANTPTYRGAGITSGATWRLVSAGPDRIQGYGGGYVNQYTSIADKSRGLDYDPTNGTVSVGDLVRISSAPGPISGPTREPSIDRVKNKYNDTF